MPDHDPITLAALLATLAAELSNNVIISDLVKNAQVLLYLHFFYQKYRALSLTIFADRRSAGQEEFV